MKIVISNEAYKDIESIFEYISFDSIKYANETLSNIYSLIYKLETFPYLGKYVPEFSSKQYRQLLYKSYKIVYSVSEEKNTIYIHFIIHTKRDFLQLFEKKERKL